MNVDRHHNPKDTADASGPLEPATTLPSPEGPLRHIHPHRQLAHEWEETVQKVRELPEFEHFLRRKPYSQLRQAAAVGPVVVLNASALRSDALILPSQEEPLRPIFATSTWKLLHSSKHVVCSP